MMHTPSANPENGLSASEIRNGILQIMQKYTARDKKKYLPYSKRLDNEKKIFTLLIKQSGYNNQFTQKSKEVIGELFEETRNNTPQVTGRDKINEQRKKTLIHILEKKPTLFDNLPETYKKDKYLSLHRLYNTYQRIYDISKTFEENKIRREQLLGEEFLIEYLESNEFIRYMRSHSGYGGTQHISSGIEDFIKTNKTNQGVQLKIIFDATQPRNQSKN